MEAVEAEGELLQNAILVQTSNGLVCLSLEDVLASDLNLSVENLTQDLVLDQHAIVTTDDEAFLTAASDTTENEDTNISQPSLYVINSLATTEAIFQPIPEEEEFISDASATNSQSQATTTDDAATSTDTKAVSLETKPTFTQRRGGWPKGKKRKPELLYLPPKGAATGYNLFMNERRKELGEAKLPFHVITRLIGHEWSKMRLEDKKPYLDRAEEDKRRYRQELKEYKRSEAYQLYLKRKRRKKAQYNVLSESDMDATDDIDDEDNEELYCRICDQWFHNFHNKREHFQSKQHIQSVAGDMRRQLSDYDTDNNMGNTSSMSFSTSLDESSLDALPPLVTNSESTTESTSAEESSTSSGVTDSITNLISVVAKRESEVRMLTSRLTDTTSKHATLAQLLNSLKDRELRLKKDLAKYKEEGTRIEHDLFELWKVPSLFIVTNLDPPPVTSESFEYMIGDIL